MEGLKAAVAEAAEGEKIWTAKHEALLELLTLEELAISTAAPSTMQDGNGEAGAREADDPEAAFAKACTDYSVVLPVGAAGAAFQPRGSQLQLARAALLGRCCVVVDPPGAGKTLGMLVAGLIACQKAGKRLVCVLYEPTVDLVEEVCSRINEYTRPGFAVDTAAANVLSLCIAMPLGRPVEVTRGVGRQRSLSSEVFLCKNKLLPHFILLS